ncbi:hypothetical protein ACVWXL_003300 [Bradyrhizobium sp. GM22.5]
MLQHRQRHRLAVGEQGRGDRGVATGLADLLRQIVHVGRHAHAEQDGRVELPGLGIGNALVEQCGEVAQIRHEESDRGVIH